MTLLWLALAYLLGVIGGTLAAAHVGCALPGWLWGLPLALLPWTPRLNPPRPAVSAAPLRWPVSAGFAPPAPRPWQGLLAAGLLCCAAGTLAAAAQPRPGCWAVGDLAAWHQPEDRAAMTSTGTSTVTGTVVNFPVVERGRQALVIAADQLHTPAGAQPVTGQARLLTAATPRYAYGDRVTVTGHLTAPPLFEDFSYRAYLAQRGIHSVILRAQVTPAPPVAQAWPTALRRDLVGRLYALRLAGQTLLERTLPEPYAALAAGILLGIDAGIPDDLYDRFNATGASHVLVISGSNVALMAATLLALSRRSLGLWALGRWAWLPTLLGIAAYAVLVGGEASVWRAALMGSLVVIATHVRRRGTALVTLAAAGWLMLLFNPSQWQDVGFQLSALATLGLILYTPRLTAWLKLRPGPVFGGAPLGQNWLVGLLHEGGVMTAAASLLTLPLIAYHFARVSLVGLLVNLLIVPAQPLILIAGSAAVALAALGLPWAAPPLLWVAWLGLLWTERLVTWAAALPGASMGVTGYGLPALLLTYAAITAATLLPAQSPTAPARLLPRLRARLRAPRTVWLTTWLTAPAGLLTLLIAAALVWAAVFTQPDGRLHVYFLDVEQGDGILIQTPGGRQVLIDGGVQSDRLLAQLGAVMPWWDRHLDVLLLTHPDRDHMAAQMGVWSRFRVDHALLTSAATQDPAAEAWRAAATQAGAAPAIQSRGGWLDLGDGVALWTLWPPAEPVRGENADNENSLVTKLVYGDFSVLLTGDAGVVSEAAWLATGASLRATALKVGHHGSRDSTSPALVAAVDPTYAVIQVGAANPYGHPAPDVLDRLAGRVLLRTDEHGRITLSSDGRTVWVATAR
jgi:competence protein ComEC